MGQARAREQESDAEVVERHLREWFTSEVWCMVDEGKGQDIVLLLSKMLEVMQKNAEGAGHAKAAVSHKRSLTASLGALGISVFTVFGLVWQDGKRDQKIEYLEHQVAEYSTSNSKLSEMQAEVRNMKEAVQQLRESLERRR